MNWKTLFLVFALPACLLVSGCGGGPPTGKEVTVQFRRDALGSGQMAIPPTTDRMNGARVSLRGNLKSVSEEWLLLDINGRRHWISRDSVLLIRLEN